MAQLQNGNVFMADDGAFQGSLNRALTVCSSLP
jgi:hypothetical protein